jgi:hypothetical protein
MDILGIIYSGILYILPIIIITIFSAILGYIIVEEDANL